VAQPSANPTQQPQTARVHQPQVLQEELIVQEADLLPEQLEHIARYANDIRVSNAHTHKEPYEKLD